MKILSFYDEAHLIVASVRVLEFTKRKMPTLEEVSEFLSMNLDKVNLLSVKLEELDILEIVEGSFDTSILKIKNHNKSTSAQIRIETIKLPKNTIATLE